MIAREVAIAVADASQIGEARRQVRQAATDARFTEADRETAALIVTELATNLVRHATDGEIHMRCEFGDANRCLEILSIDRGPGMPNVDRCMEDGFSTGGTSGTGLGATRRLATEFGIYSAQPTGTIVLARLNSRRESSAQPFSWGAVSRPAPGETLCGDAYRITPRDQKLAVMVVDGLGHGPLAAAASEEATTFFDADPFVPLAELTQRIDARMRGTRGAAMAVAQIDVRASTMKYVGVGNISAHLRSDDNVKGRGLVSHNGTLGVQTRKIQEFEYKLATNALLIMHSDGLQSRWSLEKHPGLSQQHPAIIAAVLYRDYARGHDDVTVAAVRISGIGVS
jgi:anti-sigma regulatory factor (Ser/Thr protein kinase)